MAKKRAEQMKMDNILPNSPLADATDKLFDLKQKRKDMVNEIKEAEHDLISEMKTANKASLKTRGKIITIEETPSKETLKIKNV